MQRLITVRRTKRRKATAGSSTSVGMTPAFWGTPPLFCNETRFDSAPRSEAFEESLSFSELGEESFVGFEFARVDAAAKTAHSHRVLEMEHFVVEEILDCIAGA